MCGRFTLHTEKEILERQFRINLDGFAELRPSYNIAPGGDVLTVRSKGGEPVARLMRWGLIPNWAKPLEKLPPMINARVETIATRAAYRLPFRRRRCWILGDGFYEWQSVDRRQPRQPHWVSLASGEPFAMAGIWDVWFPSDEPDTKPLVSCSIVTAPANAALEMIHPRMPVMLPSERAEAWLDPALDGKLAQLRELLVPVPADALRVHPVSLDVNSPDQDDPHLIEPVVNPAPTLF